MPFTLTMPEVGETVTEGTIERWLKKPGDKVEKYEPIVEINTDKVNVELPCPVSGTLTEILAQEGATIPVGGDRGPARAGYARRTRRRRRDRAAYGYPPDDRPAHDGVRLQRTCRLAGSRVRRDRARSAPQRAESSVSPAPRYRPHLPAVHGPRRGPIAA